MAQTTPEQISNPLPVVFRIKLIKLVTLFMMQLWKVVMLPLIEET